MDEKSNFFKKSLDIKSQIELLKSRGLIIDNEELFSDFLKHNQYYRLEGYWYAFYDSNIPEHRFKKNTKLSNVLKLYEFDSLLRSKVFKEIEVIEISLRSIIAYNVAENIGVFPYEKLNYKNDADKDEALNRVKKLFNGSKEDFINAYKNKYNEDIPPIWMLVEIMTFGDLINFYEKFLTKSQGKTISKVYGINSVDLFVSWMKRLNIIRNICAHHGRLWNKNITTKIMLPNKNDNKSLETYCKLFVKDSINKLYNSLLIIQYLLENINGSNNSLIKDICSLAKKYDIDLKAMGFPSNSNSILLAKSR